MLARRPNRRDASIHLRHKALSALNRIRIPLYKKYGRVIGVCSEMHPNLDMRYRLRIISTVAKVHSLNQCSKCKRVN